MKSDVRPQISSAVKDLHDLRQKEKPSSRVSRWLGGIDSELRETLDKINASAQPAPNL